MALNEAVLARLRGKLLATATLVMGCHGRSAAPPAPHIGPEAGAVADASIDASPPDAALADAAPADAVPANAAPADAVPADAAPDRAKKRPPRPRVRPQPIIMN